LPALRALSWRFFVLQELVQAWASPENAERDCWLGKYSIFEYRNRL